LEAAGPDVGNAAAIRGQTGIDKKTEQRNKTS